MYKQDICAELTSELLIQSLLMILLLPAILKRNDKQL